MHTSSVPVSDINWCSALVQGEHGLSLLVMHCPYFSGFFSSLLSYLLRSGAEHWGPIQRRCCTGCARGQAFPQCPDPSCRQSCQPSSWPYTPQYPPLLQWPPPLLVTLCACPRPFPAQPPLQGCCRLVMVPWGCQPRSGECYTLHHRVLTAKALQAEQPALPPGET